MRHYNLVMIGFGNVGKAFAKLLLRKKDQIAEQYQITTSVTAIATANHGAAIDLNGIDLEEAIRLIDGGKVITPLSKEPPPMDGLDCIRRSHAEVLLENTPVNYETGQPAVDFIRAALGIGMHAVTANKGPIVHAYRELTRLADAQGVKFLFESSVMDGAPIFSLFRSALPTANLLRFQGVLNSTTNVILTAMERGRSFKQAVAYTQSIGIAETNPSGDIDGWDASVKVAALITVLMNIPFKPQAVDRQGIRGITTQDIADARAQGKRWKLVCTAERTETGVSAKVVPQMISPESPLYLVDGTTSIVQFETDVLGKLSIIEENPGLHTTAYGLLSDYLNAVRT